METIEIQLNDYTFKTINYRKKIIFELGEIYMNDTLMYYLIKKEHKSLILNFTEKVAQINYKNMDMQNEFSRYIPQGFLVEFTINKNVLMTIKSSNHLISLNELLYYDDLDFVSIPLTQSIWIINRMYNLLCFLNLNHLVFNGFTSENLYLSMEKHSIYLLGGWFYTKNENEKIEKLPKFVYNNTPSSVKSTLLADFQTDRNCLYSLAQLLLRKNNRELFSFFLTLEVSAPESIIEEFELWTKKVQEIFPKKEFVKWIPDIE